MCVQNLDDSRGLAIRITYRISLRSSSLWEPRHPLLKVLVSFFKFTVFNEERMLSGTHRFYDEFSNQIGFNLHILIMRRVELEVLI